MEADSDEMMRTGALAPGVVQGPQEIPRLWSQILHMALAADASNSGIGNYFGLHTSVCFRGPKTRADIWQQVLNPRRPPEGWCDVAECPTSNLQSR